MKTAYLRGVLDEVFDARVLYFVCEAQGNGGKIRRAVDYARPANQDLTQHAQRVGFGIDFHTVPTRVWAPFGYSQGWVKPLAEAKVTTGGQ